MGQKKKPPPLVLKARHLHVCGSAFCCSKCGATHVHNGSRLHLSMSSTNMYFLLMHESSVGPSSTTNPKPSGKASHCLLRQTYVSS